MYRGVSHIRGRDMGGTQGCSVPCSNIVRNNPFLGAGAPTWRNGALCAYTPVLELQGEVGPGSGVVHARLPREWRGA